MQYVGALSAEDERFFSQVCLCALFAYAKFEMMHSTNSFRSTDSMKVSVADSLVLLQLCLVSPRAGHRTTELESFFAAVTQRCRAKRKSILEQ